LLNISNEAEGDVLYYNGSAWVRLAKGTASQVLTMNAGATAPEWGSAGSGTLNAVEEGDVQEGGSDITTLDFDATDFDVSENPDKEINISLGTLYHDVGDPAAVHYSIGSGLTADSTWNDLDISAHVGSAAVLAHLRVVIEDATTRQSKFRENGNSNAINIGVCRVDREVDNQYHYQDLWIQTDSSGVIEAWVETGTDMCNVVVAGYID